MHAGHESARLWLGIAVLTGLATVAAVLEPALAQTAGQTSGAATTAANATTEPTNTELATKAGRALLKYLVLAIVLESAMTTLFQWRRYQKVAYRRGWKTPITVAVAYLILTAYPELDAFTDVLKAVGVENVGKGYHYDLGGFITRVLTAFLLAGGSAGFVKIYQSLGIRPPVQTDNDPDVIAQTTLRVRINRGTMVSGPVTLQLDEEAAVTAGANDWLFRNVAPGRHLIRARAAKTVPAGAQATETPDVVYVSGVTDVNPAGLADFTIKF